MTSINVGLGLNLGGQASTPSTSSSSSTPTTSSSTSSSGSGSTSSSASSPTASSQLSSQAAVGTNVYMLVAGYLGTGPMAVQGFYNTMANATQAADMIFPLSGQGAMWRVVALPVVAQNT